MRRANDGETLPRHTACAADRRHHRRAVRAADRARGCAHGHHSGRGDLVRPVADRAEAHRHRRGRALQRQRLYLDGQRRRALRDRLPDRQADGADDYRGELRFADGAYLHHRLHARRSGLPALLQLHRAVHLLHADAGDVQQFPAAVLRLGGRGPGVLPADRFLVHPPERDLRQPQGLPGEPGGGFRFPARHRRRLYLVQQHGLRHGVRRGPAVCGYDCSRFCPAARGR